MDNNLASRIKNLSIRDNSLELWSVNEVMEAMSIDNLARYRKIVFDAMMNVAARGINICDHFMMEPTDILITDYGLCRLLKAAMSDSTAIEGIARACDIFEMYTPHEAFSHDGSTAFNDYFLMSGDTVRLKHEIGKSKGLAGALATVQCHTPDALAVIVCGQQLWCRRTDIELVERRKR